MQFTELTAENTATVTLSNNLTGHVQAPILVYAHVGDIARQIVAYARSQGVSPQDVGVFTRWPDGMIEQVRTPQRRSTQ